MTKVSFSNLKLKVNTNTNKIEGTDIEVLQYLPIEEKSSLINLVLQNALENGIYSNVRVDAYFHLFITMMYTNLNFTDKQKEDLLKLYDILKSNGIIDKVIMAMDENEYNNLLDSLNQQIADTYQYKNSLGGIVATLLEQLPLRAEQLSEIVDNFDAEKFSNVLEFAKAANGGRLLM